jgi:hypothetical protein
MGEPFNPGGIRIDDKSEAYYDEVYAILNEKIYRNVAGRVILQWIEEDPHYITIVPSKVSTSIKPNAISGPKDMNDPDLYAAGEDYYLHDRRPPSGESDFVHSGPNYYWHSHKRGTGAGRDIEIAFSPGDWPSKGLYGSKPDEVLFHELIHSLRMMSGVSDPIPMPKIGFENEEEFFAVTCGNVYMSTKCKCETGLRDGDHVNILPLKYPLSLAYMYAGTSPNALPPFSVAFLADPDYRKVIAKCAWKPAIDTVKGLASIPDTVAPYNPFHEFRFNLARYQNLKPGFDYVKQYNNMVDAAVANFVERNSAPRSPGESTRLDNEKFDLDEMMRLWPDGNNDRFQ